MCQSYTMFPSTNSLHYGIPVARPTDGPYGVPVSRSLSWSQTSTPMLARHIRTVPCATWNDSFERYPRIRQRAWRHLGEQAGEIEWLAFPEVCGYTVQRGCCLTLAYGVYLKHCNLSAISDALIIPSDDLFNFWHIMSHGSSITPLFLRYVIILSYP